MDDDRQCDQSPSSAGSYGRIEAWLRAIRELSLNPRAEVVDLLTDWVSAMVDGLGFEAAGVFECDFEQGRLFPWLGKPQPGRDDFEVMDTPTDRPFVVASPICLPPSCFSHEISVDVPTRDYLRAHTCGSWRINHPTKHPGLSRLAEALGLERFLWVVHFSHSGIRNADILFVAGFFAPVTTSSSPPNWQADEREFTSLGRHVGALIDNSGLVSELDQERTSLRQTNEQLDATKRQLEQIFRALPGALLLADSQHIIQSVNEAATQLLACSEDTLLGTSLLDLFEQPAEITIDALARRGSVLRTEAVCKASTGARVPVLLSASLLPSVASLPTKAGMVCIALDIADRKKLEVELRQAQKLESVGRLAAGVAHEINTPVQFVGDSVQFVNDAIHGVADLIAKCRALRASVQKGEPSLVQAQAVQQAEHDSDIDYFLQEGPLSLKRAIEGLDRVANIVRAMKEFAHPDWKEMAVTDINRCVESTLTVARSEYKYVADVVTELGDIPPVQCVTGEINQVILNIVVNAAHAIADKVKDSEKRGTITVKTRAEHDSIVLSISDDGGGIPEAIRDRIYDPFFTTKEVGRGTGQGLAIARSVVVDKHHGELWFESETGKGTSFFIRLPVSVDPGDPPA